MRPADIDAPNWPPLFEAALNAGVFSDAEKLLMIKALLR
jgi:hypothetical protein